MKTKLFCILLFFFHLYKSTGQVGLPSPSNNNFFWVNLSPQLLSSPRINVLLATSPSLTYSIKHTHFLKIKYYETKGGAYDTLPTDKPSPNRLTYLQSFSIQYGIGKFITRKIIGTVYCGLSYNNGTYRQNISKSVYHPASTGFLGHIPSSTEYYYNFDGFKSIGVPITLNFILPVLPIMAVGVEVYANIHKYSDFGVAVSLNFGHIINRKNTQIQTNAKQ